jgi:hypothetical protein
MKPRFVWVRRVCGQDGYVLIVVMLVLVVIGMMAATLMTAVAVNQQHVRRDRSFTESLEVAEAGLNRYLWMVAAGESCEQNDFAIPGASTSNIHKVTSTVTDQSGKSKGSYTMEVEPPSSTNASLRVTITGRGASSVNVPRTITATIGRPSFSEYVMLTDDPINIGGPVTRQWWGKTHSNTQVQMDTYNINDMITSASSSYNGNNGVYSTIAAVRDHANSKLLWEFPVPKVDFATVTADFERLNNMATNAGSAYAKVAPITTNGAHGWYIKLGPGSTYQVAKVTGEYESYNYNVGGAEWGGYLRYAYYTGQAGSLSPPIQYPPNGVIFVNDNVWVEGTGVTTRITIAASGQFNSPASTVDINIVGDTTYAALDGKAAIGLVAQRNIKIPMYAPSR